MGLAGPYDTATLDNLMSCGQSNIILPIINIFTYINVIHM